jgi:hypothetical protein
MNKHGKVPLIAKQVWSIASLGSFVAASAWAQTLVPAPVNDATDATGWPAVVSRPELPSPSRSSLTSANGWLANVTEGVLIEFTKAWLISGAGTNGREGAVLIFRMQDGGYRAKLQGFTNQYKVCSFKWNPAAIAIVHTHPNNCDPRPAEQDRRVADKYGVPNFTITISGMYVYDPETKKTSKVLNGLDWLDLSSIKLNSKAEF